MEYLIVVNKPLSQKDESKLGELGEPLHVPKEKDIVEFIHENYQGQDVVAGVGGDGTHSKVAKACIEAGIPAILVPYGTGNDFTRALGHFSFDEYIGSMKSGKLEKAVSDIIEFEADGEKYCSIVGIHLGLFADASDLRGVWSFLKKHFESSTYLAKGVWDITRSKPQKMKVTLDGNSYDIGIWAGQVANTPTTGGGKVVMPDVSINDGYADLFLMDGDSPKYKLPGYTTKLDKMDEIPIMIKFNGVKEFEIEGDDMPLKFAYDGEYVGTVPSLQGRVIPDKLELYVPDGGLNLG